MKSTTSNFFRFTFFLFLSTTLSKCTKFTEPQTPFNNKVNIITGGVQGVPSASFTVVSSTITCQLNDLADSERGVCYSLSPGSATIANNRVSSGVGVGTFNTALTNLIPGITYYYRSYLIYANTSQVFYGDTKTFSTPQVTCASVITSNPIRVNTTTASIGGNVTSDGGSFVNERGVLISLSNTNPTIGASNVYTFANGGGVGTFSQNFGLQPGTRYYVRAYAINSVCTSYGNTLSIIW